MSTKGNPASVAWAMGNLRRPKKERSMSNLLKLREEAIKKRLAKEKAVSSGQPIQTVSKRKPTVRSQMLDVTMEYEAPKKTPKKVAKSYADAPGYDPGSGRVQTVRNRKPTITITQDAAERGGKKRSAADMQRETDAERYKNKAINRKRRRDLRRRQVRANQKPQ